MKGSFILVDELCDLGYRGYAERDEQIQGLAVWKRGHPNRQQRVEDRVSGLSYPPVYSRTWQSTEGVWKFLPRSIGSQLLKISSTDQSHSTHYP